MGDLHSRLETYFIALDSTDSVDAQGAAALEANVVLGGAVKGITALVSVCQPAQQISPGGPSHCA